MVTGAYCGGGSGGGGGGGDVATPLEKVPTEQGVAAALPAGHAWPAGHGLQLDWPRWSWYSPAGQSSHRSLLTLTLVPARHSTAITAPALHAWPPRQFEQLDWPAVS